MSVHGLKAVAIQFSWRGRQFFPLMYQHTLQSSFFTFHFSFFTFHFSLFTLHFICQGLNPLPTITPLQGFLPILFVFAFFPFHLVAELRRTERVDEDEHKAVEV
ncbi:MAG TPA: hypothetical protein PLV75_06245 [Saprospiraceae bacterium]|jgi:hypothetical protein|nr:hypothetical protein [Saprospiraceae bacterium]HQW25536.1 hypothetical protein [Saprospiraceae bacterium]